MKFWITFSAAVLLISVGCSPSEEPKEAEPPKPNPKLRGPDREYLKHAPAAPADLASPPEGASMTASGLATIVLKEGDGSDSPTDDEKVTIHYTGWDENGEAFGSTVAKEKPEQFDLRYIPAGLSEGIKLMCKGEQRRLWVPAELGYAGKNFGTQGNLCYDVELIDFEAMKKAPKVAGALPEDECEVPEDAEDIGGGIFSVVLKEPTGVNQPSGKSVVTVRYSGWTVRGTPFDSSGEGTASFSLAKVIPGWTHSVQQMRKGEKRRVWIPGDLAYGVADEDYVYKQSDAEPKGTLIFDIELVSIL